MIERGRGVVRRLLAPIATSQRHGRPGLLVYAMMHDVDTDGIESGRVSVGGNESVDLDVDVSESAVPDVDRSGSVDVPDVSADVAVSIRRGSDVEELQAPAFESLASEDYVAVATVGDEVVGWVFLRVERPVTVLRRGERLRFDGPYLWGLYVEPAMRERGIGSELVTAATRFGTAGDAVSVYALVQSDNDASRRLFGTLGFRKVDEVTSTWLGSLRSRLSGRRPVRQYGEPPAGWTE